MAEFSTKHLRLDIPRPEVGTNEQRNSPSSAFRSTRIRDHVLPLINKLHRERGTVRILDIGGAAPYWRPIANELIALRCAITLVNLDEKLGVIEASDEFGGLMSFESGDARDLNYPDNAYDFVHSNSVIEHVGSWLDMRAMAHEIRRLAPSYFVQTPNFWFPYEPHYRKPFFHWLPEQVRARWMMKSGGTEWPTAPTMLHAVEWIQRACLLDRAQMAALFPDARIENERVFGLVKSLMAIKQ